jgi:hypothetical protein
VAQKTQGVESTGSPLPLFTELPRWLILGNSYSYARIPIRYRGVGKRGTINSAGLPSNGRRGESSDYRQLLFASPPSSRTDRES